MININNYDVIYDERVYKCVDMDMMFENMVGNQAGVDKPKFLTVVCINEDGNIILVHDESWRFRFIRKPQERTEK